MRRVNGRGDNTGTGAIPIRDTTKHWCAKCHGNPGCGQPKIDRAKFDAWKRGRASQTVPYQEIADELDDSPHEHWWPADIDEQVDRMREERYFDDL